MNLQYYPLPTSTAPVTISIQSVIRSAIESTSPTHILMALITRLIAKGNFSAEDLLCICYGLKESPHFMRPTFVESEVPPIPSSHIPIEYSINNNNVNS